METKRNISEERALARLWRNAQSETPWSGLAQEQCGLVEKWLFEEHLSYAETAARVLKEFGKGVSVWSVGRFCRSRSRIRRTMEMMDAEIDAGALALMPVKTEDMRTGAVKLLAKNAVELGIEKPEDVAGLMAVTKVLLQSEENDIRLRRVKLEERYYDFEANAACAEELKKVRAYLIAVERNENLTHEEKVQKVHEMLFGKEKVSVKEAEKAPGKGRENAHDAADVRAECG